MFIVIKKQIARDDVLKNERRKLEIHRRTERQTDGHTDGRTDGRADRQTDRETDGQSDGRIDIQTNR